ncbi:hypothetical protein R3P38DRAFT_1193154 [Favolaschia claudopus]|uniref:Uncharacterized protein n=1 Tax=Favolaschia claudopus TaxID=2862362 RepID=A0AAW0E620_9AGAR
MPPIVLLNSIRPSTASTQVPRIQSYISKRLKNFTLAPIMLLQPILIALIFGALGFSTNAIAPPKIRADQSPAVALTNAERFALGLPPLPPRRPATPRQVAPRSGSSPLPLITYTCLIALRQTSNNQILGYIRPVTTSGSQLNLQSSAVNALVGTFKIPIGVTSQSGLLVYDTSTGFVLVGRSIIPVIQQIMSPSLNDYVILASLDLAYETSYFESAIWSYDVGSKILTPQWVNPDGAVINLNADVFAGGYIRLTGSLVVPSNVKRVRFECVGL